jgi:hypothetical protein
VRHNLATRIRFFEQIAVLHPGSTPRRLNGVEQITEVVRDQFALADNDASGRCKVEGPLGFYHCETRILQQPFNSCVDPDVYWDKSCGGSRSSEYADIIARSSSATSQRIDSGSRTTALTPKLRIQLLISWVPETRNSASTPPSGNGVRRWLACHRDSWTYRATYRPKRILTAVGSPSPR